MSDLGKYVIKQTSIALLLLMITHTAINLIAEISPTKDERILLFSILSVISLPMMTMYLGTRIQYLGLTILSIGAGLTIDLPISASFSNPLQLIPYFVLGIIIGITDALKTIQGYRPSPEERAFLPSLGAIILCRLVINFLITTF